MILLKEQEESLEIFSSKTIYCTFPANNCQNSACGQNSREYWVLFVLGQSYFSISLNYKIFLFFLCKVESEALKAELVALKGTAVAASAGERFGLLRSSVPASERNTAMVLKVRCRVSMLRVGPWVTAPHPQFGMTGLATSSAQPAWWRFEFHVSFTLKAKHMLCSTGVKGER